MKAIERFQRFNKKIYNSQDVLKNHILDIYPIHYTDNVEDIEQVRQYADVSDYVWLIDKSIDLYRSFPLWLKVKNDKEQLYMFPYVYKKSKRVKSWKKVQLVPTKNKEPKKVTLNHICGEYDVYMGKNLFDIFFIGNKETGTWENLIDRFPHAVAVNSYQEAIKNSQTDMFWVVWDDLIISDRFNFSYQPDEWSFKYPHVFGNNNPDQFDGIALMPKNYIPTDKELEYRFFVSKKQVRLVASKTRNYDIFTINNYEDYKKALEKTNTTMFWGVPGDVDIDKSFNFEMNFEFTNRFDREITHVFKNGENYDGVALFSTINKISEDELKSRTYHSKKEWDIVASKPKPYDTFIVNTYDDYLTALENSKTNMFWGVPSDVTIKKNFDFSKFYFEYQNKIDRQFVHVFKNGEHFDGIVLFPTETQISKKEFKHRFYVSKKEWNIVASKPKKYDKFTVNNYDDYLAALEKSTTEMFWGVPSDVIIEKKFNFDLYFSHHNFYDRSTNHLMLNGTHRDGIVLFSKNAAVTKKEIETRFYTNKKDWDILASNPKRYDLFNIDNYDDYLNALEKSTTEMFWASSNNIKLLDSFDLDLYFPHYNVFDRSINHTFWHCVDDDLIYEGVILCTKKEPLTENEINYRTIIKRKEWEIIASEAVEYDKFIIGDFKDFKAAHKKAKTELFWVIPEEVTVDEKFNFDLYFPFSKQFDRKIHHVFKNGDAYDGIALISKHLPVVKNEITHRFYTHKKQYEITASYPKPYDVVFISNGEENAEINYNKLLEKFPLAKRVSNVKGIHQAHIAAATLCSSEMFWVVDGDAEIIDDFNFDYYIPHYDPNGKETVHVWKSLNPVNSLVYGYGAVKLLPRQMTLDMDVSKPDMTTSISKYFKSINRVSNITKFNTDEFTTWRSAFRECVKLASKTIQGQKDEETEFRLKVWCTRGRDKDFGEACVAGAIAGRQYGLNYSNDPEELKKINDFEWLEQQFKQSYQST